MEIDFGELQRRIAGEDALRVHQSEQANVFAARTANERSVLERQTLGLAQYLADQLRGQEPDLILHERVTREVGTIGPFFKRERIFDSVRAEGWTLHHSIGESQELSQRSTGRTIGGYLLSKSGVLLHYCNTVPGGPDYYNRPHFVVIDRAEGIRYGNIGKHSGFIKELEGSELTDERTRVELVRLASRFSISLANYRSGAHTTWPREYRPRS
jgi:hypothetical protein